MVVINKNFRRTELSCDTVVTVAGYREDDVLHRDKVPGDFRESCGIRNLSVPGAVANVL